MITVLEAEKENENKLSQSETCVNNTIYCVVNIRYNKEKK